MCEYLLFSLLDPILLDIWACTYATSNSLVILDNFTAVKTHFSLKIVSVLKNLLNTTLKSLHSLIFKTLEKTTFMLLFEALYKTVKKNQIGIN